VLYGYNTCIRPEGLYLVPMLARMNTSGEGRACIPLELLTIPIVPICVGCVLCAHLNSSPPNYLYLVEMSVLNLFSFNPSRIKILFRSWIMLETY